MACFLIASSSLLAVQLPGLLALEEVLRPFARVGQGSLAPMVLFLEEIVRPPPEQIFDIISFSFLA